MQNTGTWNSDLAILFFFCLMAPIAFHFLGAVLGSVSLARPEPKEPKEPKKQSPITRPVPYEPPSINISVNMPNCQGFEGPAKNKIATKSRRTKKPTIKTVEAAKKTVTKTVEVLTNNTVITEAVGGLCSLGYKKGDATRVVKSLSNKKEYKSAESLIKDCFMCIS